MARRCALLRNTINNYVELRRSLGFKFSVQNRLLQNFSRFAEKRGETHIHSKTILEWASLAPSQAQRRTRLLTIRRMAISVEAEDKRHEVPPDSAFGHKGFERRKPYILSTDELKLLLTAASNLKSKNNIRPITCATLFALLAATGLRVSEALALNIKDITEDGLVIRATKFRKDRLVPLHKTTWQGLQHYLTYRIRWGSINPSLFISDKGNTLSYSALNRVFLRLCRSIGLRASSPNSGVRLHDLRHRFAVRSIEQCPVGDPAAISRHMIALSTYLGHANLANTYWYLQATPKLMSQIAKTQEAFYKRKRK